MKLTLIFFSLILPLAADSLRTAQLTAAVNDVQIFPGSAAARSGHVGDKVSMPSSVQTGRQSRAELTFQDNTLTRIGQNSIFSFREGGRNVELKQGSVLLQVPKNAGGATIRTATVTAAITGTTTMFEYCPNAWVKLITLEGSLKLSINGGKTSMVVPAGKMLILHPNATTIPQPVDVDIAKLVATSALMGKGRGKGVFGPLPDDARNLVQQTVDQQSQAKRDGGLIPTRSVISGPGGRNAAAMTNYPFGLRFGTANFQ